MELLSAKSVARRLGCSLSLVYTLDEQLTPIPVDGGRARVYDRMVVERVAAQRDEARDKRSGRAR